MPLLSEIARKKKRRYFFDGLAKDAHVLEVGCGSGWVGEYLKQQGWTNYVGLDLFPPADVVGDVCNYPDLGLQTETFDAVVAFEVVEHVDCFRACYELLKPGGRMLITTPLPHRDWVMKVLETVGLNQKRTSPHDHLVDLTTVPLFRDKQVKVVGGLSQWGIFVK